MQGITPKKKKKMRMMAKLRKTREDANGKSTMNGGINHTFVSTREPGLNQWFTECANI